jgi:transmembrane sensor
MLRGIATEDPHRLPLRSDAQGRAANPDQTHSRQRSSSSFSTSGAGPAERVGEVLLSAGEQAIITTQTAVKLTESDVLAATAWTQGHLVFQATTLEQVADEFNRYNKQHIIIRDPQISGLKITGVFSSTDPASLILFLQARPDLAVTLGGNEIFVTRK